MSSFDGNEGVMSNFEPPSDKDVEALLAGRTAPGLEAWPGVIERIRQEATASVDPETAGAHVLKAATAASASAPSPVPSRRSPAKWRRKTVFASLFSTLIGKIVIGTTAVAAATASAGAANILPEPVDNFIERNFVGEDTLDEVETQIRRRARIQEHLEGEEAQTQTQNDQGQDQEGQQSQNQQGQDQEGQQSQNQQGQDQEGQQSQNQQGPGNEDATQTQTQSGDMNQNRVHLGDQTQVHQSS